MFSTVCLVASYCNGEKGQRIASSGKLPAKVTVPAYLADVLFTLGLIGVGLAGATGALPLGDVLSYSLIGAGVVGIPLSIALLSINLIGRKEKFLPLENS